MIMKSKFSNYLSKKLTLKETKIKNASRKKLVARHSSIQITKLSIKIGE